MITITANAQKAFKELATKNAKKAPAFRLVTTGYG
jgi:hypothetical protein